MQQLSSPRLRERRSCSSAANSTNSFEFLSDGKFIKYLGIKSLNTFPHIQLGLMSGTKGTRVQIQYISVLKVLRNVKLTRNKHHTVFL